MAAVYGFLGDYAYAPVRPMLDSARLMARRAVELDSMLPETRTALAVTLGDAGDFAGAEREFRLAIRRDSTYARAHYWYSILLVALGRGDEALHEAKRAAALDPFAPRGVRAMQRYATYLMTGVHPELAMSHEARRPILKMEPGEPWARAREAYDLAQEGKCDKAVPAALRARQLVPSGNMRMLPYVGTVYAWCGERRRARALLDSMKRRPDVMDHGFRVALLHVAFGERDSALAWLPRHRWTMAELSALRADRMVDLARTDPRYPVLLRRLGVLDDDERTDERAGAQADP
jgi:tetratricopeptide (TPR) repeat protein